MRVDGRAGWRGDRMAATSVSRSGEMMDDWWDLLAANSVETMVVVMADRSAALKADKKVVPMGDPKAGE